MMLGFNSLPTKTRCRVMEKVDIRAKRGVGDRRLICALCGTADDDVVHLFVKCPIVRDAKILIVEWIWAQSKMRNEKSKSCGKTKPVCKPGRIDEVISIKVEKVVENLRFIMIIFWVAICRRMSVLMIYVYLTAQFGMRVVFIRRIKRLMMRGYSAGDVANVSGGKWIS